MTYNGGNPALLGQRPGGRAAVLLAWRRRSRALFSVAAAFAFQFLPGPGRAATFQYHYLTAVLFGFIAIAYVLDEILRDRYLRDYGIAFLVAVAITGLLIYPLNSALAMPDWYVNAARAPPPWNYAFQFPRRHRVSGRRSSATTRSSSPSRPVVSLGSVAFASFGRDLLGGRASPTSSTAQPPRRRAARRITPPMTTRPMGQSLPKLSRARTAGRGTSRRSG